MENLVKNLSDIFLSMKYSIGTVFSATMLVWFSKGLVNAIENNNNKDILTAILGIIVTMIATIIFFGQVIVSLS